VLERSGFHALGGANGVTPDGYFRTIGNMDRYKLPWSGQFTEPSVRPENGVNILEVIKLMISKFFSAVVFTCINVGGAPCFLLTSQPGWLYEPVNSLGLTSYMNPSNINVFKSADFGNIYNIFNLILNKRTTQVDVHGTGWGNAFSLMTIDKFSGKVIVVSKTNPLSIRDPSSPDFLGYMRVYFQQKSALGGKSQARDYLNQMFEVASKPRTLVSFSAWGRDTVLPLDIIKVDNNNIRVSTVSGTISREQNSWMMEINGENLGIWNEDDPSNL
jgi:hypothetical protein